MLPWPSASPWALLHLFARWAHGNKKQGGFTDDRHKAAAAENLNAMVHDAFLNVPAFNIPIHLLAGWLPSWPTRQPECHLHLVVSDGIVCWESFSEQATLLGLGLQHGWWKCLQDIDDRIHHGGMSLAQLLMHTSINADLEPFHAQLVWYVGWQWQSVATVVLKGNLAHPSIQVSEVSGDDLFGAPNQMDWQLENYLATSRRHASGQLFFTGATDKATVCGLGSGVQTTVFGL